ncbi:dienelactone hydrolase family protein [Knoellia subterranea]|uniref:Carboxymethylenebutenolidase n=1 Tax=Knoellia subterranea KCTC 19937 TaxID=1385521 RepID=A0A0A0JPJ0_9MICO|nr:dienelactone hydrolase family protein [Knoellia subterranea]KGN38684.1 carboxymethylenebutenolidase [Knoellia subterranea KCTC 19937]
MADSIALDIPTDLLVPETANGHGIVLFQEIFGVTDYIRSRAQDLADLGFHVLVPHFYGRQGDPVIDEGADGLPRAMALLQELDWEVAVADGIAALEALRAHPDVTGRVGLLGFCFGGGLAFNVAAAAQRKPDGLVSYYGSALPNLLALAPDVPVPSLHHFGDSDTYIPMTTVRDIEKAVTSGHDDVTFDLHPGAGHAFDNPSPMFHHPEAAGKAWARTTDWLSTHFPGA